jgi:chromosome segregation ATPase
MTERWTDETLDRFASTVVTSIAASNEHLARVDEQLERMATESERSKRESDERMARIEEQMQELTAISQATSRDVAQLVTTQQQSSQALNEAMIRLADTQEGVVRLLSSLDEDRPTILRKLNTIEGKVDSLLQRENQS